MGQAASMDEGLGLRENTDDRTHKRETEGEDEDAGILAEMREREDRVYYHTREYTISSSQLHVKGL